MKTINQYIKEQYLIDKDYREDPRYEFNDRGPDYTCHSKQDFKNIDIDSSCIDFIRSFTRNTLYIWEFIYKNPDEIGEIIKKYRKANNIQVGDFKQESISNGEQAVLININKETNEILEIYITIMGANKIYFIINEK